MAYRVKVFEVDINGLFNPAGGVGIEARKQYTAIKAVATAIAPLGHQRANQKHLKTSHRSRYVPKSFTRTARYYVENTADHALFVHQGTTGPIYPRGNKKLKLDLASGYSFRNSVQGQKANPWIRRAANTVLSRYGVRV